MRTFHLPFLFFIVLAYSSCVPEPIPIELPEHESLPVVWTQAIPGQGVVVYLAKSFTALSYQEGDDTDTADLLDQMLVNDGQITIQHNGSSDTLAQWGSGVFVSLDLPYVPGDTYVLNATDWASGKHVSAETIAYEVVEIDSLDYQMLDSNKVKVRIHFTDPVVRNYYAVHFYSRYANVLEAEDPLAASNTVITKLVTDWEFQEPQTTFEVEIDELDSDTLYVSLNNIGRDYFDYLGQRQRGGNIYNQLVQEPINYVSNIQGGYGMFTMHLPSVRMLILAD